MAIYECKECHNEEFVPRRYRHHFGDLVRCPRCGTFRVTRLKEPDHIDPIYGGFLDLLERLVSGGKLFHCRYCRVQFYDRRRLSTDPDPSIADAPQGEEVTPPAGS